MSRLIVVSLRSGATTPGGVTSTSPSPHDVLPQPLRGDFGIRFSE